MVFNFTFQQQFHLFVLLSQFPDEFVSGTLIDRGFVFDLFCPVCISQSGQCLVKVHTRRRQRRNHDCLAENSKQTSQLNKANLNLCL